MKAWTQSGRPGQAVIEQRGWFQGRGQPSLGAGRRRGGIHRSSHRLEITHVAHGLTQGDRAVCDQGCSRSAPGIGASDTFLRAACTRPYVLSSRCASFCAAPCTAYACVAACSVTATGCRPWSRASIMQRWSCNPPLSPFSSLRCTSTRVTWSLKCPSASSICALTCAAYRSWPSTWAPVFT
jgi:hypothetical protein